MPRRQPKPYGAPAAGGGDWVRLYAALAQRWGLKDHEIGALTDVRLCELYLTDLSEKPDAGEFRSGTEWLMKHLTTEGGLTREQAVAEIAAKRAILEGKPKRPKQPQRG